MNLPCPFCGGEPVENIVRIFCKKCNMFGPIAWSTTEAWVLWNHRVLGREEISQHDSPVASHGWSK